jgi:hypothetical protein
MHGFIGGLRGLDRFVADTEARVFFGVFQCGGETRAALPVLFSGPHRLSRPLGRERL